mgnify:CR=1 FL=1
MYITGFNAAISGCFFAVESVLRTLSADSAPSLTTAMILLSSVLASVISQAGLGSDPAFKIPAYDFRSPAGKLFFCFFFLCIPDHAYSFILEVFMLTTAQVKLVFIG